MSGNSIGSSVIRKEGRAKVTGERKYIDDLPREGQLYGVTVRSSVARGRIQKVDYNDGVPWDEIVVVTAQDIPAKNYVALLLEDQPYLADGVINHPEEPVLLLAHADREVLIKARGLVTIDVEPLPAIHTIEEAESGAQVVWGEDNVLKDINIIKGDVDAAFQQAERVVTGTYRTGAQEQLYIETNGVIADATSDAVTIHGSLQCPYYVHKALKILFGLADDKVRIVQAETGGGFGGKEEYPSMIAGHAALLSRKAGRPVRMIYDRAEDMVATTKRHPSRTHVKTATDKDGKLQAIDIDFALDGGAYATLSAVVLSRGAIHAAGPYDCPNVRIRARAYATNIPPHGAFRGFGAPQSLFAIERHMDRVASELQMAPAQLRQRNFLKPGGTTATNQLVRDTMDMDALLKKAMQMTDYEAKVKAFAKHNAEHAEKKGIGLATFYHGAGFTGAGEKRLASKLRVEATPDGRVRVFASSTEIGQGTNTVFSQIAADALGVDYDMIEVVQPDTAQVPDSGPTVASRTVMVVGQLVENAAKEIRQRLIEAGSWDGKSAASFAAGCAAYSEQHGKLSAVAQYKQPDHIEWDEDTYQGDAYVTFAWAVYLAEVTVDPVSYQVRVDDFVAVQDIGHVMHPILAAGQIEGGVAQAIGFAVYEECVWQDGRMANGNMTNYIMPTSADLPPIRVAFVETPGPHGPGKGARGIGELPMDGAGPAIANALSFALGRDVNEIPATPERLQRILAENP